MIDFQVAISELHNEHYQKVVTYFYSKIKDLEQSKELTQIVFLKLCNCKEIEKVNVKYLYGIAKNVLRSHWFEVNTQKENLPIVDGSEEELSFVSVDYTTEVERKLEDERLLKKAFEEMSSHLTQKQLMVFLLRYQERKSIEDIMLRLNLNEAIIKKRLWNSRKKLKHIYGDQKWLEIWNALNFRVTKKMLM